MTLSLLIDSQLAKLRDPQGGHTSHDFHVDFKPPIMLERRKNFRAVMNRLITMTYSWYNIATSYNNNKLH